MTEPDLAPRRERQDKQDTRIDNPFSTPPSISSTSPTLPEPCAHPPPNAASPRTAVVNGGWERYDRYDRYGPQATYKPGSMSSAGDSTLTTPMSYMDLEKASLAKEQEPPTKRSSRDSKRSKGSRGSRGSKDPEKAMPGSRANSHQPSHHNASSPVAYLEEDGPDEGQRIQEDNALKILLFMSGPCVLLSAINTAWACIALIITALSQPIRFCAKRPSFAQQLAGLLGPTLNLQLRCIYTPLPPHANEDASYHTFMLTMVHMLSPFLSFLMMFAAWTLAVYWLSSQIVGDPAGQDKRDDGKEAILGLRRWWERWLLRSVQDD